MNQSRRRGFFVQLAALFMIMSFRPAILGSAQDTRDWKARTLQSIAAISVETQGGKTASGIVFLTVKDGLAAAASHILRDARKVTVRFPNGEEFESTGVVDHDEKRNVALIKLRVFGKPLLSLKSVEPAAGEKVYCGVIKDGAFGFIEASVVENSVTGGVRRHVLAGDIPEGNSGSPALDASGAVLGLLAEEVQDGGSRYVILPSSYILALDHSLPTQPWVSAVSASGGQQASTQEIDSIQSVDNLLKDFFIGLDDHKTWFVWANVRSRGQGYLEGVAQGIYDERQALERRLRRMRSVNTDDPLRKKIVAAAGEIGAKQYVAMEEFIKSIVIGQQMQKWSAQAQDTFKRSVASWGVVDELLSAKSADILQLYELSTEFKENLPDEVAYRLNIKKRPSSFRLGVNCFARNPFHLLVVLENSFAKKLGFRPGDRIIAVDGKEFGPGGSVEDFKLVIQNNLGKILAVIVERAGKQKTLKIKIPREIPEKFLYAN